MQRFFISFIVIGVFFLGIIMLINCGQNEKDQKTAGEMQDSQKIVDVENANFKGHILSYEKVLTDDTNLTFSFGNPVSSGYTFTTRHRCGNATYLPTD